MPHLVSTVGLLEARGIEFLSLPEQIETPTPQGWLFFRMTSAFSRFEADLIRERTEAGGLLADRNTFTGVAAALGVSRATIYRYVRKNTPPS